MKKHQTLDWGIGGEGLREAGQKIHDVLKKQDEELAAWMEEKVYFPNTMVDQITPVTTSEDIDYLQNKHNLHDECPVICKPFVQWIVKDKFPNRRPPLEKLLM